MEELKKFRKLVQKTPGGNLFRYSKRMYKTKHKVIGVLRVFDGPENRQGFYVCDPLGKRIHLPELFSWEELEDTLIEIDGEQ